MYNQDRAHHVHDPGATQTCDLPISGTTPDGIAPLSRTYDVNTNLNFGIRVIFVAKIDLIHFRTKVVKPMCMNIWGVFDRFSNGFLIRCL